MYKKFGYSVYRQVIGYYSGPNPEDAYGEGNRGSCGDPVIAFDRFVAADMRLALPKDVNKESIVPLDPLEVYPSELD